MGLHRARSHIKSRRNQQDSLPGKPAEILPFSTGILIGHDFSYAKDLSKFPNLHVRVSIKGCTEEEFEELTGCSRTGFQYQIQALKNLLQAGVVCHPAVMVSFSPEEHVETLRKRLAEIHHDLKNIEEEVLIPYPEVEKRLNLAGFTIE